MVNDTQEFEINSLLTEDQKAELTALVCNETQKFRDNLQDWLKDPLEGLESSESRKPPQKALLQVQTSSIESLDEWAVSIAKTLSLIINAPSKLSGEVDAPALVKALLILLLSLEVYDSRTRSLLKAICQQLHVEDFVSLENEIAAAVVEANRLIADGSSRKQASKSALWSRAVKIGLASLAGGAIMGVTGGLAAPLVASSVGAILGGIGLQSTIVAGLLGTLTASSTIVGSLFGGYGAMRMGDDIARYTAEIEDFQFEPLHVNSRLHVTIGISGWLTEKEGVVEPWKIFSDQGDQYALRWEVEALLKLGTALTDLVLDAAFSYAKKEILKQTVLASLMAALWPVALLKASKILDNPWRIAFTRAEKAGKVLADVIINKAQGNRPVTLVGFSLGARIIYCCLLSLAERNAYGLVENAYLLGAPCPCRPFEWQLLRSVVSGRLVNVFSKNDFLLGFLYRSANIQLGVAGLEAIPLNKGVENIDVTDLLDGHLKYQWLVGKILKERVQIDDLVAESVYNQENDGEILKVMEQMNK